MARTLLLLIGVLAVLVLGASGRARADTAHPCHETAAPHHGAATPSTPPSAPGRAPAAMACCATCVSAPAAPLPDTPSLADVPGGRAFVLTHALPGGLSPAPEPGPPRV